MEWRPVFLFGVKVIAEQLHYLGAVLDFRLGRQQAQHPLRRGLRALQLRKDAGDVPHRLEEAEAVVRDILSLPPEIESVAILFRTHRTGNALRRCIDGKLQSLHMQENAVSGELYSGNKVSELFYARGCIGKNPKGLSSEADRACQLDGTKREDKQNKIITERLSSVSLITFHASKGLEFDAVYIISANEGITPLKSAGNDEIEEERRLFYVALTRAKKYVHISDIFTLYNKKQNMSRFVRESLGLLKTMNVLRHLQ